MQQDLNGIAGNGRHSDSQPDQAEMESMKLHLETLLLLARTTLYLLYTFIILDVPAL